MGKAYKCLVADDHPIVRQGIKHLLLQEGPFTVVAEAADAASVIAAVRREAWHLLMLDVALPDKHGLEVLKDVRLLRPSLPVLMLSLYPEREFALRAFRAGASGYLTKDRAPAELLVAVRQVLAGQRYITETVAEQMAAFLKAGQPNVPHDRLSDREMEVLRLVGQGRTVSTIADQLALSVKTVSTYRARLLSKLHLQTTAELVRYAVEHRLIS